jgi:hypothetical protein
MVECIQTDSRLATSHQVDIIVRKDGREQRFEADWIKVLGRIYRTKEPLEGAQLPPPVVVSRSVKQASAPRINRNTGRPQR